MNHRRNRHRLRQLGQKNLSSRTLRIYNVDTNGQVRPPKFIPIRYVTGENLF